MQGRNPITAAASPRTVYGLGIESDLPLAALADAPVSSRVDVRIHYGAMPAAITPAATEASTPFYSSAERDDHGTPLVRMTRVDGDGYLLIRYIDGTTFAIDADWRTIWATWPDSATLEDTATYLLGPVLGIVLRMRGTTCLHGSAIAVDDGCIALVGMSGAGKSTAAAAFAQAGFPVLADDIVALREHPRGYTVLPAYPRVRLWPESVAGLFGTEDALPLITPGWSKRFLPLDGAMHAFGGEPKPLKAIYFLSPRGHADATPQIESIGAREALMDLVHDTYGARLLDPQRRADEFVLLAGLVKTVALRRLHLPDDLARLREACATVLADVRATYAQAANGEGQHV